ncbi:hypothetical protein LQ50_12380 [Halalkalibacter okhensis]|uniref:Uncharacterized protein n=1 Tax=Halalkalibacter okhensis TaxID=333138 RepID=A0A0B0IBF2_9BACI|nr:hypothetical protein LQ50_12380 [Halalkalibacter okhensis]
MGKSKKVGIQRPLKKVRFHLFLAVFKLRSKSRIFIAGEQCVEPIEASSNLLNELFQCLHSNRVFLSERSLEMNTF